MQISGILRSEIKGKESVINEWKKSLSDGGIENLMKRFHLSRDEFNHQIRVIKKEYGSIITSNVAKMIVIKQQLKKAPFCKCSKKDGGRCNKRTRHSSKLCYIHRMDP